MANDSHALRVRQLRAVGAEAAKIDGRPVWALFNDDTRRIDFGDRVIRGRDTFAEVSEDDLEDARRGSTFERADGTKYTVEDEPERFDAGMARLRLVARQ